MLVSVLFPKPDTLTSESIMRDSLLPCDLVLMSRASCTRQSICHRLRHASLTALNNLFYAMINIVFSLHMLTLTHFLFLSVCKLLVCRIALFTAEQHADSLYQIC